MRASLDAPCETAFGVLHLPAVHAVIRPASVVAGITPIAVVTTVAHIATGLTLVAHVDILGRVTLLIPIVGRRGRARGPGLTGYGGVGVLLRKHVEQSFVRPHRCGLTMVS